MVVPTRRSYVLAVVAPEERTMARVRTTTPSLYLFVLTTEMALATACNASASKKMEGARVRERLPP